MLVPCTFDTVMNCQIGLGCGYKSQDPKIPNNIQKVQKDFLAFFAVTWSLSADHRYRYDYY